jgi:deazaflavin-dependent oxidoreductase (nitroreductase family)
MSKANLHSNRPSWTQKGGLPTRADVESPFWFHIAEAFRKIPFYWEMDRFLVRWTRFSIITWFWSRQNGYSYLPALLLETIGRKSGALRPNVLPYFKRGTDYIIIGSLAGGPNNPQWVENIRAEPRCWLVRKNDRVPFKGRIATSEERAALISDGVWHGAMELYQSRAATFGREIPYVVLSPGQ